MHMSTVPNIVEKNNYMFGKKKTLPWQMIYKLFFFYLLLVHPTAPNLRNPKLSMY